MIKTNQDTFNTIVYPLGHLVRSIRSEKYEGIMPERSAEFKTKPSLIGPCITPDQNQGMHLMQFGYLIS